VAKDADSGSPGGLKCAAAAARFAAAAARAEAIEDLYAFSNDDSRFCKVNGSPDAGLTLGSTARHRASVVAETASFTSSASGAPSVDLCASASGNCSSAISAALQSRPTVSKTGPESDIFPASTARSGSVNFAAKTSLALRVENIALRLHRTGSQNGNV